MQIDHDRLQRLKQFLKHIIVIIAFFLFYQIASTVSMLPNARHVSGGAIWICFILGDIALIASVLFCWWYYHKLPVGSNFLKSDKYHKWRWLVLLAMLILIVLFQSASNMLPVSANQQLLLKMSTIYPVNFVLSVVILGPINEELIFRGLLIRGFFPKLDTWPQVIIAIAVSGIIFGYLHTESLSWTMLIYIGLGMILASTYVYFDDIRYSIGLHMLMNLVATVLIYLYI